MAVIIGLTGSIASGKSTVSEIFKEFGYPVIDADYYSRKLLDKDNTGYQETVKHFGQEILKEDGNINRQSLKTIIFENPSQKDILQNIIHPLVKEIFLSEMKRFKDYPFIILDVPLLFETDFKDLCQVIITVFTNKEILLKRLLKRDNINESLAEIILAAQMSPEEKKIRSDYVIDNSYSLKETRKQLEQIIKEVGEKYGG